MNHPHITTSRRRPIIAALVVALLAACSGGDDTASTVAPTSGPTTSAESTTTSSTSTTGPPRSSTTTVAPTTTVPPIPRQPLTGEPLGDGEEPIGRPALAVKIDNQIGARRNHRGLAVADIVFEEIVEGDITRFAAVFHSQGSEQVGPIRSGRSQDVDLLTSFDRPLFAWSGGNPGVERLIAESTLTDLNWQAGGQGYYRGAGSAPHNLYNDTETLWSQTPDDLVGVAPQQQFVYLPPTKRFQGDPVASFDLAMRGIDVEWTWDAESSRFLRSQEGAPHEDVLHGRIGATNVIVMVVEYLPSQIDARSPEAQTVGNGPAYVFSDGAVLRGRWVRDDNTQPISLINENGKRFGLTPGNTWIELAEAVPSDDIANPDVALIVQPAG
jgi:Protein of unknown function (DUF3048) N-terminal domain/Protein of unknown function (DUF3048) C-terminal domain